MIFTVIFEKYSLKNSDSTNFPIKNDFFKKKYLFFLV